MGYKNRSKVIISKRENPQFLADTRKKTQEYNVFFAKRSPHRAERIAPSPTKHRQPHSLLESFSSSLTPKQWLAVFILLNVGTAYAVNTEHQIKKDTKESANPPRNRIVPSSCESNRHLSTVNKPPIQLAARAGQLIPSACLHHTTPVCEQHLQLMRNFVVNVKEVNQVYHGLERELSNWEKSISATLNKLISQLTTSEEESVFAEWIQQIATLKKAHLSSMLTQEKGGGTCDQHKDVALTALFQQAMLSGEERTIQVVIVHSSEMQTSFTTDKKTQHPLNGHAFILIDSQMEDTIVRSDKIAVAQYLDAIKDGIIIDTWNNYCEPVNNNSNSLYRSQAGWDDLLVFTVKLDFKTLQKLPPSAQRFFCRELSRMDLPLTNQPACGFFQSSQDKAGVNLINTDESLKLTLTN